MTNPFQNTTPITAAQYAAMQAANMLETPFQDIVVAAAKRMGYLVYHTHDSRRSEPGYPDLHLVHVTKGVSMFRELKTMKGRPTAEQTKWLGSLSALGIDAGIWRPIDWFNGTIVGQLEAKIPTQTQRGHDNVTVILDEVPAEPWYITEAADQVVFLEEQLGLKLMPWQREQIVALAKAGTIALAPGTDRAAFKRLLNRINPAGGSVHRVHP